MAIYNKDSRLCDALLTHPDLIPVVNRLGVALGVGDGTIEEICLERNFDANFFLSVVNTFVDENYFPINAKDVFSLEKTVDYLQKTGEFYQRVQLPNIEHHFNRLVERSGKENNLELLRHFFIEMKNQFSESIQYEKNVMFPEFLKNNVNTFDSTEFISVISEVEEKLQDLLAFFVVHLKGEYDHNLCMAVVTAVSSLYNDICQNNRIRKKILLPLLDDLKHQR